MKKKSSATKGKAVKKKVVKKAASKAAKKSAKPAAKSARPKTGAKRKSAAAAEKYSQSGAPWWKQFM